MKKTIELNLKSLRAKKVLDGIINDIKEEIEAAIIEDGSNYQLDFVEHFDRVTTGCYRAVITMNSEDVDFLLRACNDALQYVLDIEGSENSPFSFPKELAKDAQIEVIEEDIDLAANESLNRKLAKLVRENLHLKRRLKMLESVNTDWIAKLTNNEYTQEALVNDDEDLVEDFYNDYLYKIISDKFAEALKDRFKKSIGLFIEAHNALIYDEYLFVNKNFTYNFETNYDQISPESDDTIMYDISDVTEAIVNYSLQAESFDNFIVFVEHKIDEFVSGNLDDLKIEESSKKAARCEGCGKPKNECVCEDITDDSDVDIDW